MEEGPEGLQKPNIKYSASLPMLCELPAPFGWK